MPVSGFSRNSTSHKKKLAFPVDLEDGPDIRQRIKELKLAKLDKNIRMLKSAWSSNNEIGRIVANNILLLDALRNSNTIAEVDKEQKASMCLWCGASGEEDLKCEGTDGINGNRGSNCGHLTSYG